MGERMLKTKVLHALRNATDYVSGQMLCDQFSVSRTAVWKCINQLKEEGYVIEAVQNRGYCITSYPDLITDSEIESLLIDQPGIIQKLVYFKEIDSTNNEAKRQGAERGEEIPDGTLFIAECQNGGRGRRGKGWISPEGSGIWMSLLLRPQLNPNHASMLTLVAAMAVTKAITEVTSTTGCRIKWPNDIVFNKRKICGILTEMSAEMDFIHYVVIGIGINVNTEGMDSAIENIATSLYAETGQHIKRSSIVAAFSKAFEQYYRRFLADGNLSGFLGEYNSILINVNKEVKILGADKEFTGIALGINETGELLVKRTDGTTATVCAGEVSVRGLYGYV